MAVVTPNPSTPLGQALTRKRTNPLPMLALSLGLIVAIVAAVLGFLESQRTEQLVILARDLPYGRQIVAEDLSTIELPLHRPSQLAGVADPSVAIGMYPARDLGKNDIVQPAMLLAEPPSQPIYPNGQQLGANMVPLPFSTATIGPLSYRDRVNVGFNDPSGSPDLCDQARTAVSGGQPTVLVSRDGPTQPRPFACRLLASLRVLYVDEAQGIAYLELTPYQSHTIWALQAAGLQLWGERYGSGSAPLENLDRLDIGQVNGEQLATPVQADQPGIPGEAGRIPGAP